MIIQAPQARNGPLTATLLKPYAAAGDIHGVDIYPISHPPGLHAGRPNTDISVVGDVTALVVQSAPAKEHWTTLQVAWSGVLPPKHVPIFPSLHQERFMAYQAIVAGASGLVFFGGDITRAMTPADAENGWNWTFWHTVLKHVVQELTSTAVGPALVAPPATVTVKADATDVRLVAREADGFLYLITSGGARPRTARCASPASRPRSSTARRCSNTTARTSEPSRCLAARSPTRSHRTTPASTASGFP